MSLTVRLTMLGAAAITSAVLAAPAASAAPPNCTAGDLANVNAGVSVASATYLFSHPDVNTFITDLRDLPKDQADAQLQQYLDANPQIKSELQAIRQPLADLSDRCGGN